MNLWAGEVDGGGARVRGSELRVAAPAAALSAGRFTIGVRPEDVALSAGPVAGAAPARVLVVEPMGSETIVTLESSGARVVARGGADVPYASGDTAWIALPADRAHFFEEDSGRRLA
jgi:multiple sugar transport system ATP-binding protein